MKLSGFFSLFIGVVHGSSFKMKILIIVTLIIGVFGQNSTSGSCSLTSNAACVLSNRCTRACENTNVPYIDIEEDTTSEELCKMKEITTCPIVNCCPACSDTILAYFDCIFQASNNALKNVTGDNVDADGICRVTCGADGGNTTTPAPVTPEEDAPSISPGVADSPTVTDEDTPAPFAADNSSDIPTPNDDAPAESPVDGGDSGTNSPPISSSCSLTSNAECVLSNRCTRACENTNVPDIDIEEDTTNEELCEMKEITTCPIVNCCPACSDTILAYFDCIFQASNNALKNVTGDNVDADGICRVDCGVGSSTTTDGVSDSPSVTPDEDAPAESPVDEGGSGTNSPNSTSCSLASNAACVLSNRCTRACENTNVPYIDIEEDTTSEELCKMKESTTCPIVNCCPPCSDIILEYFDCLLTSSNNAIKDVTDDNADIDGVCRVDCAAVGSLTAPSPSGMDGMPTTAGMPTAAMANAAPTASSGGNMMNMMYLLSSIIPLTMASFLY